MLVWRKFERNLGLVNLWTVVLFANWNQGTARTYDRNQCVTKIEDVFLYYPPFTDGNEQKLSDGPIDGFFFLWLPFALVLRPSLQHRHHDSHSHDIVTNGWKIMSLSTIQSQHAINIYQLHESLWTMSPGNWNQSIFEIISMPSKPFWRTIPIGSMVLEYESQHLPHKWPGFVGFFYIPAPWIPWEFFIEIEIHRASNFVARLFGADICERYFKLFIRGDESSGSSAKRQNGRGFPSGDARNRINEIHRENHGVHYQILFFTHFKYLYICKYSIPWLKYIFLINY